MRSIHILSLQGVKDAKEYYLIELGVGQWGRGFKKSFPKGLKQLN